MKPDLIENQEKCGQDECCQNKDSQNRDSQNCRCADHILNQSNSNQSNDEQSNDEQTDNDQFNDSQHSEDIKDEDIKDGKIGIGGKVIKGEKIKGREIKGSGFESSGVRGDRVEGREIKDDRMGVARRPLRLNRLLLEAVLDILEYLMLFAVIVLLGIAVWRRSLTDESLAVALILIALFAKNPTRILFRVKDKFEFLINNRGKEFIKGESIKDEGNDIKDGDIDIKDVGDNGLVGDGDNG